MAYKILLHGTDFQKLSTCSHNTQTLCTIER